MAEMSMAEMSVGRNVRGRNVSGRNVLAEASVAEISEHRTTISLRMSSKFGQIPPGTAELAALERIKNPHRLIIGKML